MRFGFLLFKTIVAWLYHQKTQFYTHPIWWLHFRRMKGGKRRTHAFYRQHCPLPWRRRSLCDRNIHFLPDYTRNYERFDRRNWAIPYCRPLQRPNAHHCLWFEWGRKRIGKEGGGEAGGRHPLALNAQAAPLWPAYLGSEYCVSVSSTELRLFGQYIIGGETIGPNHLANPDRGIFLLVWAITELGICQLLRRLFHWGQLYQLPSSQSKICRNAN